MDIISVLNTCFILCLAFAVLFFIISVVLFFVFDIRTVYNIRSGRAQAKTVKEMQQANNTTGRLRVGKTTQTSKLTHSQPQVTTTSASNENITERLGSQGVQGVPPQQGYQTAETQLLSQDSGATEVLGTNQQPTPVSYTRVEEDANCQEAEIYFEIVKKIICRDTDEIIR